VRHCLVLLVLALGLASVSRASLYCEIANRLAGLSERDRKAAGKHTGLPKEELRRILDAGAATGDKKEVRWYRNARDFVVRLPREATVAETVEVRRAYLTDLLDMFSGTEWNFLPYKALDGSPFVLGSGVDMPVILIRASDGAMFRGNKPYGTAPASWVPNYSTMTRLHP
jgi:hypothetical protein